MAEGTFQKARLCVYKDDHQKSKNPAEREFLDFMFNPEAVRVSKSLKPREGKQAGQNAPAAQFTTGNAATIEFGELLFDCFDERKNVYVAHISALESLLKVQENLHRPPRVMFTWGSGWGENAAAGQINTGLWFVTGLDVNYTMFLPNGTPVRAVCKLTLTEVPQDAPTKNSPDTAHVHMVHRGDTLQGIAFSEYDDPTQWRRIAEANGIDDPLHLRPGQRLLIPPILK